MDKRGLSRRFGMKMDADYVRLNLS